MSATALFSDFQNAAQTPDTLGAALLDELNKSTPDAGRAIALIHAGARLDMTDENGNNALILATEWAYEDIVAPLLKAGASIQATDSNGNTPRTLASTLGYETIVAQIDRAEIAQNKSFRKNLKSGLPVTKAVKTLKQGSIKPRT